MNTQKTALPKLLLNVPALAQKPREAVERILGQPSRSSGSVISQREKRTYRNGTIEIVYTEGRASWIKLYNTDGMEFSQQSLSRLGLPPKKPTYVNRDHVMSWSKICNLKEVSLYADNKGGVSSVLVCAASESPSIPDRRPSGSWNPFRRRKQAIATA